MKQSVLLSLNFRVLPIEEIIHSPLDSGVCIIDDYTPIQKQIYHTKISLPHFFSLTKNTKSERG